MVASQGDTNPEIKQAIRVKNLHNYFPNALGVWSTLILCSYVFVFVAALR